ncbi:GlsB/YeaQ/YmgE family stress response membrane protein [Actinoplanes sp. NBC_00393]|uniref:GlsB/YeaQ/YmgE family stress response membrane protein n=1 Tax=Actinoplanes sp. NBC_00393 TaxID=2975953 RepID=UPI002E20CB21
MTVMHLVVAVAVGIGIGALGQLIMPGGRRIPFWVPMTAAVGAALLATITAHIVNSDVAGVSPGDIVMQVVFAALSISLVAATADRQPASRDNDGTVR